jgi:AraC-like DNA-binding protein
MDKLAFLMDKMAAPLALKASKPVGLKGLFWYFPASARDKNWGVYVTTVGTTHVAAHQPYPPTNHPGCYDYKWEIGRVLPVYATVYISKGRGWIDLAPSGGRRQIEAGHVILLFPGMWHRYRPDPEVGWDEHWVAFDGEVAKRWMRECSFSPSQPILKSRNEGALLESFNYLIELGQQGPAALQQLLAAQVHRILATLYSGQQTELGGDLAASMLRAAQVRMQEEFATDLDLQQLARQLNVSYSWFRHAFVQQTGFSPHQYLVELRLAHARSLLTQSALKIKEVAARSGFPDEHYFSRIFKAKAGLTANEWRLQARAQTPPVKQALDSRDWWSATRCS